MAVFGGACPNCGQTFLIEDRIDARVEVLCCGLLPLQLSRTDGPRGCGPWCRMAKGWSCSCACGGENHGKGRA